MARPGLPHPGVPDRRLIPFTYSITNGVGAGLIAFVLIKVGRGKWREAGWLLSLLALIFAVYFAVDGVEALFR